MPDSSPKKTSLLYIALACSLALNVVLVLRRGPSEEPQGASTVEILDPGSTVEDAPAQGAQPPPDAALEAVEQPAAGEPIAGDASAAQWTVISGTVDHSLARTFQREAGEDGDALTSVFTRLFVWDLDMRRDLLAGDTIVVVWRKGPDGLPEIAAAALHSSKLGRTLT
ncbi:MAG: hypothetical protein E4H03_09825, partial [Myxococcales bacterium]